MPGRVTLALSGGVARCIAHIGVLQALEEAGVSIEAIAGTSGGSLVGAMYAATRDVGRMAAIAPTIRWASVTRPTLSRLSFFNGDALERFCAQMIGVSAFDQLSLPVAVMATDLRSGARVALAKGPVARAVRASCSLPVFFPPVEWEGRWLIDGGASSQLPVLAARELSPSGVVVGVDVNVIAGGSARPPSHMGQIGLQFVTLFAMTNAMRERPHADVMIDVDATGVPLHDLGKAQVMLDRGRHAVASKLGEIEAALRRAGRSDDLKTGESP